MGEPAQDMVATPERDPLGPILDAMVDAVFVTDASGEVRVANEAMRRLAGREVRGVPVRELIDSEPLHEAALRASAGRSVEELEIELRCDAGRKRWLTAQLTQLPGEVGRVVGVLHDITQLKRTEQVRRDFVANASHELRTPLTAIAGFAETLQDGALDDRETAQRFLSAITANTARLVRVVEDMIALSRAESPDSEFELEVVDVVTAVAKVVEVVEPRLVAKKLTLHQEPSLPDAMHAYADAQALDQVLLNLVDNAIKYTPEGGEIRVLVSREHEWIRVDVSDTGPGIKPKYLDRIFQRFYRVDKGRSRDQGGTGLGLSIVRHLVGRIGGSVRVHSEVGQGSTFTVRLRLPV